MCTSTYNNRRLTLSLIYLIEIFKSIQVYFIFLDIDQTSMKIIQKSEILCAWGKRQWVQMGLIVITQLEISALRNPWTWGKKWQEIYISFTNIEKCTQFQMEYYCLSSPSSYYTGCDSGIYLDTHISVLIRTHLCFFIIQTHRSW